MTKEEWEKIKQKKIEEANKKLKAAQTASKPPASKPVKSNPKKAETKDTGKTPRFSNIAERMAYARSMKPKKEPKPKPPKGPRGRPRNPNKPYISPEERAERSRRWAEKRKNKELRIQEEGGYYTGKRRAQYLRTMAKIKEAKEIEDRWEDKFTEYPASQREVYIHLLRAQFFLSKRENARGPKTYGEYNVLYVKEKAIADRLGGRDALARGLRIALGKEMAARNISMKRNKNRVIYQMLDSLLNHSLISMTVFTKLVHLLLRKKIPKEVMQLFNFLQNGNSEEALDEEYLDKISDDLFQKYQDLPERKHVTAIVNGRRTGNKKKLPPIVWARSTKR